MAIKGFKDIIDRKGYKVDSEDRTIFEKEISKSNFGLGCSDMIEFILYDASENQLPQGDDGKMVRYINIDDSNINDYFIISDNTNTKKNNDTIEFIVDIEKLIKEAGYSNGIFKTQITLLNRRVGTESGEDNNLWIHEISPSRTEIRVLPSRAKRKNADLEKRYSVFTDNKNFRDDVIYFVNVFIDSLNLQQILENFLFSKGTEADGVNYVNLIKLEFSIDSFEILLNRIKSKFIKSMKFYSEKRNWRINDINYGKELNESDCVELSLTQLKNDAEQTLLDCIEFYLPKRDIQKDNILSKEEQVTMDKVKQILKSQTSNSLYTSTVPDTVNAQVRGCTDSEAENYNPLAQENDGSCQYKEVEEVPIKGCTNKTALNYNPNATADDGSCKYKGKIDCVTKTYYVWSASANMKWKVNGNPYNGSGTANNQNGIEYDSFSIKHDIGSFKFTGDVREVPKQNTVTSTKKYIISNTNQVGSQGPVYMPYDTYNYGVGSNNYYTNGFMGFNQYGFGNSAYTNTQTQTTAPSPLTTTYLDALGNSKNTSTLLPGDTTTICAREGSVVAVPGLLVTPSGNCTTAPTPVRPVVTNTNTSSGGGSGGGSNQYLGEVITGYNDFGFENENPYGDNYGNGRNNMNMR